MSEEKATLRRRSGRLFAQVPEALIFHPKVSDRGVRLWAMLDRRCAGRGDVTMPSRQMIADALGCSRPTVDRAIAELCDAGFLHKERADRGDVNAYELLEGPDGAVIVSPLLTREDRGGVLTSDDTPTHPRRHPSSPVSTPVLTGESQVREGEGREESSRRRHRSGKATPLPRRATAVCPETSRPLSPAAQRQLEERQERDRLRVLRAEAAERRRAERAEAS